MYLRFSAVCFICSSVSFNHHSSPIKNGRWYPWQVEVVALAVSLGPVNVGASPEEDGTLEPSLTWVGEGGHRKGTSHFGGNLESAAVLAIQF